MNDPDVSPDEQSQRAWQFLRLVSLGLLGLAALVAVLIVAGAFDPRPLGPLLRSDTPGISSLPATGATTLPQSAPWATLPNRYSIRLRAAYVDGQVDIGYGLAQGDERGRLVVAVSPVGYVSVWEERGGQTITYVPWQPWPHVRTGPAENEIWLDVATSGEHSQVTARVNRELLWQGEIGQRLPDVALWLGSFDGPALVEFRALEWFAAP